ncbi:MAG: lipocalin-like domain-containing protein [Muribaculaceae bacterium]
MKALTIKIFMAMVLLAAAVSCTTNNGDIGEWMGRWKLTSIEQNGSEMNEYADNLFFAFQSTVFEVRKVGYFYEHDEKFGTWSDDGKGTLVISFPDERYKPFEELHFSQERNVLTYDKIDAKGFTLILHAPDGNTYTYHLVKW